MSGLLDRLGVAERVERAAVARDWERLVGPHIAWVTGGARVSGRTLFVEVASAAWLTELNMMRHELLNRINSGRPRGRIDRIVFVQAGKG
jgi:predicted nucleic acid-binding Zn ribbon protein